MVKALGSRIFEATAPPSPKEEAVTDIGDRPTRAIRTDLPHTEVIISPKEQRRTSEDPEWSTNNIPIFYSRECFQMYKVKLGVQGNATRDVSTIPTCSKTQTLPPQLGEINSGPVGPATIKGVQIEFMDTPYQRNIPSQPRRSEQNEKRLLQEEITSMLKKGAIRELPEGETRNGFY